MMQTLYLGLESYFWVICQLLFNWFTINIVFFFCHNVQICDQLGLK